MSKKELTHSPDVVVMSNPLITAKLDLTGTQMHVFEYIAGQINPKDENFNVIQIRIKDFAESIGGSYVKLFNELEKICKQMIRPVKVKTDDSSDYSWVALVQRATKISKIGVIEIKFSDELKPYLLQLTNNYFKIHLKATRKLENPHIKRLYWLLSAWRKKGEIVNIEFSLPYLKTAVQLEGKYKQYSDLKKWFLSPAKSNFKEFGEFYFDFEEIRFNPKSSKSEVIKVRFSIIDNPNWKPYLEEIQPYEIVEVDTTTPEMQGLIGMIMSISKGITKAQATQFAINHANIPPEDIMSEILNLFKQKAKGKEITDHLAWLAIAVKNRFNKGLFEETEEKKKEQEEQNKINGWHSEFQERFKEFLEQKANEATPEEIEEFKALNPIFVNKATGEPIKQYLGNFVASTRKEISENKDDVFIGWVRKHKGETLQKMDGKFKVMQTLF
jgi:hypothetical protein